ncbi:MAG TPA: pyruvate carboxylase subunit B [Clostridiaceae bacterium]|nr:pyruvate carboxylase subunit B [Clostridiaceae bacterium]
MKIGITETVLRDAQQSQMATRMPFSDFQEILPVLNQVGYESLECWGGATFDSCLRFLNEDPWERLRKIKEACPDTKLQMLLRGQNLLGYKPYPDDVVREFVRLSIKNGIDVIRIFDALNDLRNVKIAIEETRKHEAEAQVAICYTTSPVHNIENYVQMVKDIENMGASSIAIKDMAGVVTPYEIFELVSALKETTKLPLHIHTHSTTGMGFMSLLKAVEAGADVIDTAISAFSGGTSQPATETMVFALEQMGYKTGINIEKMNEVDHFFLPLHQQYIKSGLIEPYILGTRTDALNYKIPGGMLSNLISQLKELNAIDRFDEVLAEVPLVRKDFGYPPLVTPLSQMVGVQATQNVLCGKRYLNVSNEIVSYLRGEYGKAPGEINQDLQKEILGDQKPITYRFAEKMENGLAAGKEKIGALAGSEEDVLSYIMFPQIAKQFFKKREEQEKNTVQYTIEEWEEI